MTYGGVIERRPVVFGSLYQIGPHFIGCGDIESGHGESMLAMTGVTPVISYCDPPWTQALLTNFRNRAERPRSTPLPEFIQRLVSLLGISPTVYIEMGNDHCSLLSDMLGKRYASITSYPITYYRKNPACLVRAAAQPADRDRFSHQDDENTPRFAILESTVPGDFVLDACLGRGITARAAHEAGRRVLGLEFNPKKLAVAVDYLAHVTHSEPVVVGQL